MSPWKQPRSASAAAEILDQVRRRGVKLWSQNGELRYRAPRGALGAQEIEILRELRAEIAALLPAPSTARDDHARIEQRSALDPVPLTYSQRKYWNVDRLQERASTRTIASATRLRGRLDTELLRLSIAGIVERHEALRTRIVMVQGVPMQQIARTAACELVFDDLTTVSASEKERASERIFQQLVLEPVDVSAGPLMAVRLVRLDTNEHVLMIAIEHIVSDAFSMNILLRDLFAIYRQRAKGTPPCVPAVPIQIGDYAVWQEKSHKAWLARHGWYWNERLAGCARLRFHDSHPIEDPSGTRLGATAIRFSADLKPRLVEWCRQQRTTIVMGVFTAFVTLILRWYEVTDGVVQYQTDGRFSPQLENTIGYLACALNLRVGYAPSDTFSDLLRNVTQEYCSSQEHADHCYIEARVPAPTFTRNPGFNWVPHAPEDVSAAQNDTDGPVTFSRVPYSHPELEQYDRDHEPMIVLFDKGTDVDGAVYFPGGRFSARSMEDFARNFELILDEMLREPGQRIGTLQLIR